MHRYGLKTKLILSFMLFAAMTVLVGGVGVYTLNSVAQKYDAALNGSAVNNLILGEMKESATEATLLVVRLVTAAGETERGPLHRQLEQALKRYEERDAYYNTIPFVAGERGSGLKSRIV